MKYADPPRVGSRHELRVIDSKRRRFKTYEFRPKRRRMDLVIKVKILTKNLIWQPFSKKKILSSLFLSGFRLKIRLGSSMPPSWLRASPAVDGVGNPRVGPSTSLFISFLTPDLDLGTKNLKTKKNTQPTTICTSLCTHFET